MEKTLQWKASLLVGHNQAEREDRADWQTGHSEAVLVRHQWICGGVLQARKRHTGRRRKIEAKRPSAMKPPSENSSLPLAAILSVLTCVLLQGAHAGVVGDFNHGERCKDSLYMGTPPRGYLSTSLKKICQRYEDKPRYVTLYDPQRHIPIYSAYTFKKSDGEKKVDFPWMFEPQVRVLSSLIEVKKKC